MTNYTIYLVNQSDNDMNFWCFLQAPSGVPSPGVFANSSTSLRVSSNYAGTNRFPIPLQYVVGAGSINHAVSLNTRIESYYTQNIQMSEVFKAEYATVPHKEGPRLSPDYLTVSDKAVGIQSNGFDKVKNEQEKWYANLSFGIQSENGFMGVTWSPSPDEQYVLTPTFAFYIATGDYMSNHLADLTEISTKSVKVELGDFQNLEVTVTLTREGTWQVAPGKPGR